MAKWFYLPIHKFYQKASFSIILHIRIANYIRITGFLEIERVINYPVHTSFRDEGTVRG